MSRDDWLRNIAFTAFFLAVVATGILGFEELKKQYPHPRDSAQYAANEQAKRDQRVLDCYRLPFEHQLMCVRDADNAQRNAERAEQDVAAQDYMARSAFWLWTIGLIQALVAVLGIYFIARTLDASRAAVDAANRTTDEATRIGEAQVRAYLSCVSAEWSVESGYFRCTAFFKNFGQSPAKHIRASYRFMFQSRDENGALKWHKVVQETLPASVAPIPAGATEEVPMNIGWKDINRETFAFSESVRDPSMMFLYTGTLTWVDVFEKPQSVGFTLTSDENTGLGEFRVQNRQPDN